MESWLGKQTTEENSVRYLQGQPRCRRAASLQQPSVISVLQTSWTSLVDPIGTPDVAACSSTLTGLGLKVSPDTLDDGLPDWVSSGIQRYGIMDKAHDLVM